MEMKTIIKIMAILLCVNVYSQHQFETNQYYLGAGSTSQDTLNYIKSFETTKAYYIGKPFSVLLNALGKVQPKTVISSGHIFENINIRPASRFQFKDRRYLYAHDAVILRIEWQTPLPTETVYNMSIKNDALFTNEEKTYYSSKIVKDIRVYRRGDF
jgi:hypothetical protein